MSRPVKCLKGSQLIVNLSLLYLSRHPGFVRKSSSGGLPCGALGHRKISTREMRRVVVVVLVAKPCATHSQGNFLSLHGHSPIRRQQPKLLPAPRRPTRWQDDEAVSCETLSAGSQHSAHSKLSLLTQARIPS